MVKVLGDMSIVFTSKAELVRVFSVTRRTIDIWIEEGLPRHESGENHFLASAVFEYVLELRKKALKQLYDRKLGGSESTVALKEQQLRIKIEQEELNLREQRKKLIPVSHVEEFVEIGCNQLQRAAQVIGVEHGDSARATVNEALDSWKEEFERRFKGE